MKVTVTEGTETGDGIGDTNIDGGVSDSENIHVGDETYKVNNGKMKWENPNGDWITMQKITCD